MPLVELVMPKMGESIMEATILKWLKQPGDTVKQDEGLLEIATDKVDSEVPSTAEGVLEEVLFQVNDVVPVGSVIARIRTGATADNSPAAPSAEPPAARKEPARPEPAARPEPVAQAQYQQAPQPQSTTRTNGFASAESIPANRFYSPLVLNIAANEGVPLHELENIPGSGNEGRVTKKDILQYVEGRRAGRPVQTLPRVTATPAPVSTVTVPMPSSAVIVTGFERTRFSLYRPGRTTINAPSGAPATASAIRR